MVAGRVILIELHLTHLPFRSSLHSEISTNELGLLEDTVEGSSIKGLGTGRFSRVYEAHEIKNPNQNYVLKYFGVMVINATHGLS